jgi:protein CpxP
MNKQIWIFILGMILSSVGSRSAAAAQSQLANQPTAQRPSNAPEVRVRDSKRQLAHLSKKLKLTSDQELRVRAILSECDRQIDLIRGSQSLSDDAKSARIRTTVADSNQMVESVLDGRQKQKFEDVLSRQRKRKDRDRQADLGDNLHPLPPIGGSART